MIEKISLITSRAIKRTVPEHPASEAVLKYALEVLYNVVFIVGLTIFISFWTEKTTDVLILMASFAFLRQISGGLHLKSGIACVAVSSSLFTALSMIGIGESALLLNMISLVLVVIFAPAGIEKQTRIPEQYFPLLKIGSAAVILISLLLDSQTVSLGLFAQSLTLIPRKGVK